MKQTVIGKENKKHVIIRKRKSGNLSQGENINLKGDEKKN